MVGCYPRIVVENTSAELTFKAPHRMTPTEERVEDEYSLTVLIIGLFICKVSQILQGYMAAVKLGYCENDNGTVNKENPQL